jgi:signal transduction histidine kinase
VERLRSIARGEEGEPGSCDLNRVAAETLELARRELDAGRIAFRLELEPGLPAVRLSGGLLEQVVLNLLANAVHAGPGSIGLRTRRLESQAELSVSDDGPGMSRESLKRAFEPFNTSRSSPSGRAGLGLGLAICYSIVTRAGGEITAQSGGGTAGDGASAEGAAGENPGTTITVLLPLEATVGAPA